MKATKILAFKWAVSENFFCLYIWYLLPLCATHLRNRNRNELICSITSSKFLTVFHLVVVSHTKFYSTMGNTLYRIFHLLNSISSLSFALKANIICIFSRSSFFWFFNPFIRSAKCYTQLVITNLICIT